MKFLHQKIKQELLLNYFTIPEILFLPLNNPLVRTTQKFISHREITLFNSGTTPVWSVLQKRNKIVVLSYRYYPNRYYPIIMVVSFCQNHTSFPGQWPCFIDSLIRKNNSIPLLKYLPVLQNANWFTGLTLSIQNTFLR